MGVLRLAVIGVGYPPDILGNTAVWFDDLEEAVASPTQQIGNLLVLRIPAGGGAAVPGDPLRFPDGSGVAPAVPSDDLFNFDADEEERKGLCSDWRDSAVAVPAAAGVGLHEAGGG